jgi:predicted Zn-dependent protease with MMP-like domain
MERLPLVKVVIASWRNQMPLQRIEEFLSPFIREKIVGVLDTSTLEETTSGVRGQLMNKWFLVRNTEINAVWLDIDDQIRHYAMHPNNVYKTHWHGLTQDDVERIVVKVESLSSSPRNDELKSMPLYKC